MMNDVTAKGPVESHGVQQDRSGVGHAWATILIEDIPLNIAEEIATWIIEEDPEPGDEMVGSNGQHYRLPLASANEPTPPRLIGGKPGANKGASDDYPQQHSL